jgi:hypothetical protein
VTPHANGTHHERPEPRLVWTDVRRAPAGDFAPSAVPNANLATTPVPRRGDSWDAVADFALSYDGHAYWADLPELANRVLQRWTRSRLLPGTLDELRGCLFYEQRRWHHFGEEPAGRSAEYVWAIVDAIGALASPVTRAVGLPPDPRRATAPETHVTLVAVPAGAVTLRPVAASPMTLRPVAASPMTLRPVPGRGGSLVPVPAAEVHVRLVSAIGEEAGAVSRHPSGRPSRLYSGHPTDHPSMTGATADLKPMPSADALPKPPVIVRRSRSAVAAVSVRPSRPAGAVNSVHSTTDTRSSNGTWWRAEKETDPPTAQAEAVLRFDDDDAGYMTWVNTHAEGFVLNQTRLVRPKAPTLHRAGCPSLSAARGAGQTLTVRAVKVCGPNADALAAWSMAQGSGLPTACRRCGPEVYSP